MAPTFISISFQLSLLVLLGWDTFSTASSVKHGHLHGSLRSQKPKRDTARYSILGWEYKGCYTDDANSRTLYDKSTANDTMTPESCVRFCSASGYPFAGVEYGRECYCSRAIAVSAGLADERTCSFACAGNSSEICGGSSRINVLHNASDVASANPPSTNPGPPGWGFLGCYVDSVQSRTLPYGIPTAGGASNMTAANCVQACQVQNYQYAGVEYMGECYCGNSLPDSFLAPDGLSGCSMLCNGNSTEFCGGPNRLDVYGFGQRSILAPLWNPLGCYNDSVAARTLRYSFQVPGGYMNMTVPGCTAVCQANNFILAGVTYSQECWCDNVLQNYGAPASDGCNMACRGDPSTICGGSNRLNILGFNGTGSSTTSTTTSKSLMSVASTVSNTATIASSTTATIPTTTTSKPSSTAYSGNWTYQGCYLDNKYGRILGVQGASPADTTIDSCIYTCSSSGYSVAGLEYTYQCFCGNALINGASSAPESDCNMACGGNSAQMCGAGNRMSIYSATTNVTSYALSKVQNTTLPGNWSYQGCLGELAGSRVFSHMIDDANNMTIVACLTACAKYGYSAGGVEYGEQCFCGDDTDRINAGVSFISESTCSMSCPGNANVLCGGPNAITYYTTPNMPNWGQAVGNAAGSYDFLIGGLVIPLITQVGLNGKVVLTEKHGTGPPNSTGAYELDTSQVSNGMDAAWREMNGLKTDVFCSAGLTLPDKAGRVLNVGGWSGESTFGLRLYWPDGSSGVKGTNDWEENYPTVSLQAGRWYPSAMQMVNGSIWVLGGEDGSNGLPVPNSEILPKPDGGYLVYHDWLERTDPNNLYPFMTVLPSGNIAVFYYNEARIIDEKTLDTVRTLPNIPGAVDNDAAGRTYPLEGTTMLLPQHAPYTDLLQVLICGGSTPYQGFALDNCVSITPEDPNASWTIERMPDRRVITCMTALPDGTYIILNGARQGQAGFGLASDPGHMAMMYDPTKPVNSRFMRMANTTIDRLYHSEAILLLDGRILVSGSDPEDGVHNQEYRFETFTPPYLMGGLAASRPAYTIQNTDWAYGQTVTISITSGSVAKVSLMAAVASTHGNSMGQRTIFPAFSCSGAMCTITAPPNGYITGGPGWHMLFILNSNGTPSVAQWVRIGGDPAGLGNWPNATGFSLPGV